MGYDIFKFGTLCLNGEAKHIPRRPTSDGDIPQYDKISRISIQSVERGENISWIKPHGVNLLIADRALLGNISWKDLDKNGFVTGRTILLDGCFFHCRLLRTGEYKDVPNEWDKALDEAGEDNGLWHWKIYISGEPTCQLPEERLVWFGAGCRPATGTATKLRIGASISVFAPSLSPYPLTSPFPTRVWKEQISS